MHWFELYLVTLSQLTVTLALLKRGLWTLEIIVNLQVLHEIMKMADLTKSVNVHEFDDFVEF